MSSSTSPSFTGLNPAQKSDLQAYTALELAQALLGQLSITDQDWHRLKANRQARASEQVAAAIVFLLKEQPEEAMPRLQQAIGWLDRSLSAPPCPTHGHGKSHEKP
ncbi:hypothetical protein BST81_17580 [Leptolyngbya sp. 'hensonii']|uniref:DUF6439 family protein n=1 Tax=Leptolyngbya sp. 'hensonii' TaxID=1922337 RepID=UPI0009502BC9|nr:DUF6439 family protein [Leptolyngbya sp. 'hensonii']OLP17161.1 hypothetical protein BST81_17580 [Leptolyngbya sp. 'hensonii']